MADEIKEYTWKDINLDKYNQLIEILKEENYGDYRDMDKLWDLCSVITGKDIMYFSEMSVKDWEINHKLILNFLNKLMTPTKYKNPKSVIVNGKEYDVCYFDERNNETVREHQKKTQRSLDLENFIKANPTDYVRFVSTFLIPQGKEYRENYPEVLIDIENMPVEDLLGIWFFFAKKLKQYKNLILLYSLTQQTGVLTTMKKKNLSKTERLKIRMLRGKALSIILSLLKELIFGKSTTYR